MIERREFLITGGAFALAGTPLARSPAKAARRGLMQMNKTDEFWPGGARLVISSSMQMEAGAQPESGAESPLPKIDPKYPDIAATKWYEYGFKEGLPRLLDMFDRRNVKVTSHMVGAAVERHPALAKEIVQRGHEPSGHGQTWTPQYSMTPEQERKSYADSAARSSESPAYGQSVSMLSGCGVRRRRSRSCRSLAIPTTSTMSAATSRSW
jgi:hypothetical protein